MICHGGEPYEWHPIEDYPGNLPNDKLAVIGNGILGNAPFGALDHFMVFSKALSEAEIEEVYASTMVSDLSLTAQCTLTNDGVRVDVFGIGKDRPGKAARLFTAVLRGLVEHRFNSLVLEQALVHRRGDGHPVLFDRGSGGLDDGLGMFGSKNYL